MNETSNIGSNRAKVVHTLAVVGFIALIGSGMALAVYSTRYVPDVVGRLGTAAVYLGSVFTPAEEPSLSVVSTPSATSTVLSFGEASSPLSHSATPSPKIVAPTAGEETSATYQMNGATTTAPSTTVSGLPDLAATIKNVGYLTSTSTDSFVASSTVPSGFRSAVSFTIKNIGTNATGVWCFKASIPTSSYFLYESAPQQNLNPGDYIDYTLGFDQANRGTNQMISVTANIADTANAATCTRTVTESNPDNNSASANITIVGG
ncbi:MAG: hypothetical protein NUV60_00425 [Patescibacteria group bacterium]|nr:hypothetical protein [Patescibacteria group bacterium]